MIIEPRNKPKITEFRDWMAWGLVSLATWISPKNEAATAFMMQEFMEYEIEKIAHGIIRKHKNK